MPKVSDLAKELGYKAAELVQMVNTHPIGVTIANPRADVDARQAAGIRAKLPHRKDLKGAMKEEYDKIVEKLAAEAPPPKAPKKEKAPAAEKPADAAPKSDKKPAKKEAAGAVAAAAAPSAPAPQMGAFHAGKGDAPRIAAAAKVEKEKKAKEVVLVSTRDVHDKPRTAPPPAAKVGLSAEEKAAVKAETVKPLIDVDKVIGAEHEVRAQSAADAKALDKGAINVEADKAHRVIAQRPKPAPTPAPARPGMHQHAP